MNVSQIKEHPCNTGGMMRCCVQTLKNRAEEVVPTGNVLPCDYCSSSMKLDNGVWRWNREAVVPAILD